MIVCGFQAFDPHGVLNLGSMGAESAEPGVRAVTITLRSFFQATVLAASLITATRRASLYSGRGGVRPNSLRRRATSTWTGGAGESVGALRHNVA